MNRQTRSVLAICFSSASLGCAREVPSPQTQTDGSPAPSDVEQAGERRKLPITPSDGGASAEDVASTDVGVSTDAQSPTTTSSPADCPGWSESTTANDANTWGGLGSIDSNICAADGTAFWGKGANIPVCWQGVIPNWDYALLVREAVRDTWEANSAVRFSGWDNCVAGMPGIHIMVADVNPASGVGKAALDGVSASLAADPAGGPLQIAASGMVLNFDFVQWPVTSACATSADCNPGLDCLDQMCTTKDKPKAYYIKLIAVHEFGHALGFYHEQVKENTPKWCTERGRNDTAVSCDTYVESRWDPSSVMNYCNFHYTNNGRLSATDIAALQDYYGAPSECGQPGLTKCDGKCVDLETEAFHCGACGNACPAGQLCKGAGVCGCTSGYVLCSGECVRLGTSEHCSRCGDDCGRGFECARASCEKCDRCLCPDGFLGGPLACEGTQVCRKICMAHEQNSGHVH
jgi:hypothetical protein